MIKRLLLILLLLIFIFSIAGCISLKIERNVDYPAALFKKTEKKIEKIHSKRNAGKKSITGIHLLIYDGKDRKLVSFSIPKNMIECGMDLALAEGEKELKKHSCDYVDINWDKVRNLNHLCPGLIIEVEDLEQKTHVLIWAE